MANTPTRQLGVNGPQVSAIGFGCMGLSEFYGKPLPDEERFRVLDKAVELGATFLDTSDAYKDNEDLIAQWLKKSGARSKIFLCTKFGFARGPDGKPTVRSDPDYVRESCARSLKRLGVDKIDLYYCHRVDLKTPIEKTVQAMAQLKREGKIDHIGLSEVSAETLRRAHKIHPIAAVQMEYSPFALDIERADVDLLRTCRELGVAVVAYSPLGRGFLTGQLKSPDDFDDTDFRKNAPRYSKENWSNNMKLVELLKSMAAQKGCTPGQLSLAWIMDQGNDIIPIPGTKKIKYLEENMGSLNVRLTEEEAMAIRKQIETVEIAGQRFPPLLEGFSFGDTPPLET